MLICNPQKTDDNVLISTFCCGRETAEYDFRFALERSKSPDKNIAYHLIQSFAPGEVSGEEAHRIGQELADRFLQGKYSYFFTTHIDRDHIHNHLVFCACNNINHRKFRSTFKEYYRLRNISDELCAAHGKSVINELQKQISRNKESINNLRKEISHFDAILRHARYLRENQKYADAYEKSKNQERYYRSHYEQLDLYWGAVNWLKNSGIDTATMNIKQIEVHYRKLIADKSTLTTSFKQKRADSNTLKKVAESLHKFLDTPDIDKQVKFKEKDRSKSR